jgi:hypothetical protein
MVSTSDGSGGNSLFTFPDYLIRIHQSSRGCNPKRWDRFTFSGGSRLSDEGGRQGASGILPEDQTE